MEAFFYRNDHVIELRGVRNEISKAYVNDATVEAVIKDDAGSEIAGQDWPLALDYVASSQGIYRGIVESDAEVEVGDVLDLEITVTAPGDLEAFFKVPLIVKDRSK